MPKNGSVGYSGTTRIKQEHLKAILEMHIMIVKGILKRKKGEEWVDPHYRYIDITAGPGIDDNIYDGYIGSPIIFLDLIKKHQVPYRSTFIENDQKSFLKLAWALNHRYDDYIDYVLVFEDNQAYLTSYIASPPKKKQYGMLYADANGLPDMKLIAELSYIDSFSPLDILINYPATTHKRVLKSPKHPMNKTLEETILLVNKKYWFIREPVSGWQWTFLIGTNWKKFPECHQKGFYNIHSERGKEILIKLNYTAQELAEKEKIHAVNC